MANGILTLTRNAGGSYLDGQIVWSAESNGTQANTSEVTAQLQLRRSAQNTTTGTFKGTFTVGGTSKTISWYGSLPSNTWVTVETITVTVSHTASGAGSCYLYAKINGPGGTTMEGTSVSGSETVTLDTIPRYATITSAPDFHDEANPKIRYSNPAGSSVTALDVCISLDGFTDDIPYRSIDPTDNSYKFNLTEDERNVLRNATADGNSRTVLYCVRTIIGDSSEVSSVSRTLTIKDPNPTLDPTVTDSNNTTYKLTGNRSTFVKYFSNANVKFNAAAVKGASITSQQVTCGGKRRTTDGAINKVESGTFQFTVTDSRGNTVTKCPDTQFVEYVKLTCDLANNIPDANGNLPVAVSGNYFNGSFGAADNTLSVEYRYKERGSEEYEVDWTPMSKSINDNTYTAQTTLTGLNYKTTYEVEARAIDKLATVTASAKAVKATPVFDWSENDFRFHVPVAMGQNGLGVTGNKAITLADANEGSSTGWYRITSDTANGIGVVAIVRTDSTSENNLVQTAYAGGYSDQYYLIQQRCCHNGIWGPWEWVSPPLVAGTEYQTTERYLTKPVFVKVVQLGTLPNATSKSVAFNASSGVTVVSFEVFAKHTESAITQMMPLISTSGGTLAKAQVTAYNVIVYTFNDLSNYEGYAKIKYTKG